MSGKRDGAHWSGMAELGASWGIAAIAGIYKILGRSVCGVVLAPVAFYYYLMGGERRRASEDYLARVWKAGALRKKPGVWAGCRHYHAFAVAALDKLVAWSGRIAPSDVEGVHGGAFEAAKASGRGAVVLTAHVGNPEVIRAVATTAGRYNVNVLVHTLHAEQFNRVIQRVAPSSNVRLIQVTELGVADAIRLSEAVSRGEWVVLTADRTAVGTREQSAARVPFLGGEALFPTGPYALAAALKCPTFTMFCQRGKRGYHVSFELLADPVTTKRGAREESLTEYARTFAERLEKAVLRYPYQWFNFYDFWVGPPASKAVEDAA
jgi:predicted LPLAT superfamily acyltransferase